MPGPHLTKLSIQRCASALAMVVLFAAVLGLLWRSAASATPPTGGAAAAPAQAAAGQAGAPSAAPSNTAAAAAGTTAAGTAGADAAEPAPPPSDPTKAQIIFSTVPPSHATVLWGNTRLGRISPHQPLVVIRPRDSGPLDVVVRAAGYLPVQTRAHTFGDSRVQVKLTRPDQKATLFGYKAPLDAGLPLTADGGVPESLSGMPGSLTQPSLAPVPPPQSTPAPQTTPAPQPQH